MIEIPGLFRVEHDGEASFYKVLFKPDQRQAWSAHPNGITFRFKDFRVGDMIGDDHDLELLTARTKGAVEFRGSLSRDKYASYTILGPPSR